MEAAGVLSATFSLGILLHAGAGSFVSGIHGHFRTLFLVRRRIVLLAFLLSISLFAIAQFAGLLLLEDVPCQVTVIFSTTFDQAARVLGFTYVTSIIGDEVPRGEKRLIWAVLAIRALLGAGVVGFMRIDFIPVCYATPSIPVINYATMAVDGVVLLYLILRTPGLFRLFVDMGASAVKETENRNRGYGVWLISLALTGWFLASIPHNTALGSIFVRTVPMALVLTLALMTFKLFPTLVHDSVSTPGGATMRMRRLESTSPTGTTPSMRARSISSPANPRRGDLGTAPMPGSSGVIEGSGQQYRSMGGGSNIKNNAMNVHPGNPLSWSLDPADGTIRSIASTTTSKQFQGNTISSTMSMERRPSADMGSLPVKTVLPAIAGGRANISGPILQGGKLGRISGPVQGSAPIGIKTVSLQAAAENQRRKNMAEASRTGLPRGPKPIPMPADVDVRTMERTTSVKRKMPTRASTDIDRQSINLVAPEQEPTRPQPAYMGPQDIQNQFLQPRQAPRPIPEATTTSISDRNNGVIYDPQVLLLSSIEYSNPEHVSQILSQGAFTQNSDFAKASGYKKAPRHSTGSQTVTRRSPVGTSRLTILTPLVEGSEASTSPMSFGPRAETPIMDRKIPRRETVDGRGLFAQAPVTPSRKSLRITKSQGGRYDEDEPLPQLPPSTIQLPLPPMTPPRASCVNTPTTVILNTDEDSDAETEQRSDSEANLLLAFPEPPSLPVQPVPTLANAPSAKDMKSKRQNLTAEISMQIDPPSPTSTHTPKAPERLVKRSSVISVHLDNSPLPTPQQQKLSPRPVSMLSPSPPRNSSQYSVQSWSTVALEQATTATIRAFEAATEFSEEEIEDEGLGYTSDSAVDSTSEEEFEEEEPEMANSSNEDEIFISQTDDVLSTERVEEARRSYRQSQQLEVRSKPEDEIIKSPLLHQQEYEVYRAQIDDIPRAFSLGDHIPTFSERSASRRRKAPPSPIHFLTRQRRISQAMAPIVRQSMQQVNKPRNSAMLQRRLTAATKRETVVKLDDIIAAMPQRESQAYSEGRNSLLEQLEMEIGAQEVNWKSLHQNLERNSLNSLVTTLPSSATARERRSIVQDLRDLVEVEREMEEMLGWQPSGSPSDWDFTAAQSSIASSIVTDGGVQEMEGLFMQHDIEQFFTTAPLKVESRNDKEHIFSSAGTEFEIDSDEEFEVQVEEVESEAEEVQHEQAVAGLLGVPTALTTGAPLRTPASVYSPLQPTVYRPVAYEIESQLSPASFIYSALAPSEAPISPATKSFLWNPLPKSIDMGFTPPTYLWSFQLPMFLKNRDEAVPAALCVRPKQRKMMQPLEIDSEVMWTQEPPQPKQERQAEGLWRGTGSKLRTHGRSKSTTSRPKSILLSGTGAKKGKRVTFGAGTHAPAVPTLPTTTGFFGQLKGFFGGFASQDLPTPPSPAEIAFYVRKPLPLPPTEATAVTKPTEVTSDAVESPLAPFARASLWNNVMTHAESTTSSATALWPGSQHIDGRELVTPRNNQAQIEFPFTDFAIPTSVRKRIQAVTQQPLAPLQSSELWGDKFDGVPITRRRRLKVVQVHRHGAQSSHLNVGEVEGGINCLWTGIPTFEEADSDIYPTGSSNLPSTATSSSSSVSSSPVASKNTFNPDVFVSSPFYSTASTASDSSESLTSEQDYLWPSELTLEELGMKTDPITAPRRAQFHQNHQFNFQLQSDNLWSHPAETSKPQLWTSTKNFSALWPFGHHEQQLSQHTGIWTPTPGVERGEPRKNLLINIAKRGGDEAVKKAAKGKKKAEVKGVDGRLWDSETVEVARPRGNSITWIEKSIRFVNEAIAVAVEAVEAAAHTEIAPVEEEIFKRYWLWTAPVANVDDVKTPTLLWPSCPPFGVEEEQTLRFSRNPSPALKISSRQLWSSELASEGVIVPSLWKAPKKSNGLWGSENRTLAEISLQNTIAAQQNSTKLWNPATARRTTEAKPEGMKVAFLRKVDVAENLPVFTGGMWGNTSAHVITADELVVEHVLKANHYDASASSTFTVVSTVDDVTADNTFAVAEELELDLEPVNSTLLWSPPLQIELSYPSSQLLWNPSHKYIAPVFAEISDSTLRFVRQPEPVLKITSESLWSSKNNTPVGLWKKEQKMDGLWGAAKSLKEMDDTQVKGLWCASGASRRTEAKPERVEVFRRDYGDAVVAVTGPMWGANVIANNDETLKQTLDAVMESLESQLEADKAHSDLESLLDELSVSSSVSETEHSPSLDELDTMLDNLVLEYSRPSSIASVASITYPALWTQAPPVVKIHPTYTVARISLFEHHSTESLRSKEVRDTKLAVLESTKLWNGEKVEVPSLWTKKPNGTLWGGVGLSLDEMNVTAIEIEEKKGLWHASGAKRTTEKEVIKTKVTKRFDASPLEVVGGGLWRKGVDADEVIEVKEVVKGLLWEKEVDEEKEVVEELLWHSTLAARATEKDVIKGMKVTKRFDAESLAISSTTLWVKPTEPVVEEGRADGMWGKKEVVIEEVVEVEEPVSAPLVGLWEKAVVPPVAKVDAPMWHPTLARRTTTALPVKVEMVTQRFSTAPLTISSASLWTKEKVSLWRKPAFTVEVFHSAPLWHADFASRVTKQSPIKVEKVIKRFNFGPLVAASGSLWNGKPVEVPSLWKPTRPLGLPEIVKVDAPLWHISTASRTTDAAPERHVLPPVKRADKPLPVFTGSMWSKQQAPEPSLWKSAPKVQEGLWNPISPPKLNTDVALWKRRSARFMSNVSLSFPTPPSSLKKGKKVVKKSTTEVPVIKSDSLWASTTAGAPSTIATTSTGLWSVPDLTTAMTIDEDESEPEYFRSFSPTRSETSTLSDLSELPSLSPTAAERQRDTYTFIRSDSFPSQANPSSELLWRRAAIQQQKLESEAKKALSFPGLWTGEGAPSREKRTSVLITERPRRGSESVRKVDMPSFEREAGMKLWGNTCTVPSQPEKLSLVIPSSSQQEQIHEEEREDDEYIDTPTSAASFNSFRSSGTNSTLATSISAGSQRTYLPNIECRLMTPVERPAYVSVAGSAFAERLRVGSLRKKLRPVVGATKQEGNMWKKE